MGNAEPILWAFKHAPVSDSAERLVLMTLADAADEDGCNAYLSHSTIAERAMIDSRTVRRKLPELEARGLIARGDQTAANHLPADKRPVVYDVMVPYVRFMDIEQTNRYRANRGRGPLTAESRPLQPPAPERGERKDKGVPRPRKAPGHEVPPDSESTAAGHEVQERGDSESYNPPLLTLPNNPPSDDSLRSSSPAKSKRATKIPDDFAVTDAMKAWYSAEVAKGTITGINPALETEMFIDHFRSTGKPGKDWEAAWRNWLRKASQYGSSRSGRPPGPRSNLHQLPTEHPDRKRRASYFTSERSNNG
jgi:hypothetical protein